MLSLCSCCADACTVDFYFQDGKMMFSLEANNLVDAVSTYWVCANNLFSFLSKN